MDIVEYMAYRRKVKIRSEMDIIFRYNFSFEGKDMLLKMIEEKFTFKGHKDILDLNKYHVYY